jgi:hypothetical protein
MSKRYSLSLLWVVVLGGLALLSACGGGGATPSQSAMVNLHVSDPSTCSSPTGPFRHIYVTANDVQISTSGMGNPGSSGWTDLTPSLKNNPVQVDLLGVAGNQCFLASLGAGLALQPGSYQQIRFILAPNGTSIANNQCGTFANCVMLTSDPSNTPQQLLLSSETQTGIKIPSGQIAGGKFTVAAGETRDLNIDFNACQSIVAQGNGGFRLKPVLHAGEVSLTASSLTGTVVDSVSKAPITGTVVVALEQPDPNGIDRVVMETLADAQGNFSFCPLPPGTYDVVVSAITNSGATYASTVTTGVQPGNALGNVPVIAVSGTSTAPAILAGTVSTQNGTNGSTSADITVSALQQFASGSSALTATMPLAADSASVLSLETQSGSSCMPNTACVSFNLPVAAANPNVGAFSASGTTYSQSSGSVSYVVDAMAFVPQSGGTADCTMPEQKSTPLTVTAGANVSVGNLAFTGCQ